MRLRNVKDADAIVSAHPLVVTEVTNNTFNNDRPIHLEIGMGKGEFITEMSKAYPEINFVALEKYPSVMVRALTKAENLPNLRFMALDAQDLEAVIKVKIQALYLNFSDPWPKTRHAKRRLTHPNFLVMYERLFTDEINIYQKTDNKALFAYSIMSLSMSGYIFPEVSLDLKQSKIKNIPTEYEQKFMALGTTINYLHAKKKI